MKQLTRYYVWKECAPLSGGEFVSADTDCDAVLAYAALHVSQDVNYPHNEIYCVQWEYGGRLRRFHLQLNASTGELDVVEIMYTALDDSGIPEPDSMEQSRANIALQKAGRLAEAARKLVGGRDLSGFKIAPADMYNVSALINDLHSTLNAYDDYILEWTNEK